MNDLIHPSIKTCPCCGKPFECLHASGCWCFAYTLSPENAEKLRTEFNNCLCPECLPLYADSNTGEHPAC